MLHLGRSSSVPAHGSHSFRPLKQPYCASSCVYLWRLLNKTHLLFHIREPGIRLSGYPQTLYTCAGVFLSPSFARRKRAVARGFVTQEEADNEGQNGEGTFKLLTDLPWTVNTSSTIRNWGTVYQGPLEAKYYNKAKDICYPVGYACVKIYKEKEYLQSIEEGPTGPVFVVVEPALGIFKSSSPQKVWNKVCENEGIRVHGMRHFGFESSEVVRILQAMVLHARGHPHEGNKVAVDTLVDVLPLNSSAEEMDSEATLHQADTISTKEEAEHVGIKAEYVDVDEDDVGLDDSDDDMSLSDVETDYDGGYIDVSADAHNDEDEGSDVLHVSEDEDTDFGDVDEEEEGMKAGTYVLSSHVCTDESTISAGIASNNQRAGGSSSSFKRTFKSGPHKYSFTRTSQGMDDSAKHDYAKEGSNYQNSHSPSRQKALATAERQVWRKGEGLTGYVPKQQVPGKSGVVEQSEDVTDIMLDYGRQEEAESIQMGEQGKGSLHNELGLDKQLTTERVITKDSQVFSSFNSTNVVKSWESSALKRKEDIPKSSHTLLELLNKWNKTTKWDHDSGDRRHQKVEKKLPGQQDDAHTVNELDMDEEEPEEISQSNSIKDEESALGEFYDSGAVDESTSFAVSKLFESEAKPHRVYDDKKYHPRHQKPTSNVVGSGVDASKGAEVLNMNQNFLNADGLNGPRNRVQDGVISLTSPEEKNNRTSLAGKQKSKHEAYNFSKSFGEQELRQEPYNITKSISEAGEKGNRQEATFASRMVAKPSDGEKDVPKRGDDEIQLIEEVRKLICGERYQEAFQKARDMKLSGMKVDEEVYEAVLGFKLDPWQKEAFKQVNDGFSVLISGPSGAGKSAVADCCLYNNVVNEQRAIFVTPFEHLANQSLRKFETILGQSNVGGMQTRMRTQSGPKLVVITLQMLSGILHELRGPGGSEFRFFFEGVNMVVLDKFCMFGEMSQSRLWEEIFMLMDSKVQVIALTLPATNEAEIASWISTNRGPCKLVCCNLEPIQKRYLFGQKAGLFSLLDPKGLQVNSDLLKSWKGHGNLFTKDHFESSLWSGYDKLSLTKTLKALDVNAMVPAFIVFLDVKSCEIAAQDVLSDIMGGLLLSRAEIENVEKLFNAFGEKHPNIWKHIEKADHERLCLGFAVLHEGKPPLWRNFVIKLFQENLVKVIMLTESALLCTELRGRTVVLPTLHKVTDTGVSLMAYGLFLQLVGRAGQRGHDIEGNIIFLDCIHSGPQEAASLLLDNTFSFSSCFKPSYSLVVNLMANHKLAEVKKILGRSFATFQFLTKHTRDKRLKEHDQEIFDCLEAKVKLDAKLFEGLAQVNKQKLSNAAMFTRVDMRMTVHSVSHSGSTIPGILLATVPVKSEPFYMVFGADNNFRLLPAGAFDYVYGSEISPLDVVIKAATGQVLQTPLVPPKEHWTVDEDGFFGYVACGSSQTKEFVRLMMQYPVQPHFARDCLQLRKDIFELEARVSNLIEKRKRSISEYDSANCEGEAALVQMEETEIWKEAMRLVHILQKVDALSIIDRPGAYVKLKPLGMLIARLHNVENELWIASVVMSKYVKHLVPAEFTSLMGTMIPPELDMEGLFTDQRELLFRVTRSLKDAFAGLEVLRKQIAAVQGSYNPPLQFDTAFAGLVYAWARGKPGAQGIHLKSPNDGDIALKLRSIVRLMNSVYQACSQVSVDISEPNDFNNLSTLAKRAEDTIIKHFTAMDKL